MGKQYGFAWLGSRIFFHLKTFMIKCQQIDIADCFSFMFNTCLEFTGAGRVKEFKLVTNMIFEEFSGAMISVENQRMSMNII